MTKKQETKQNTISGSCAVCNAPIEIVPRSHNQKKYCSNSCRVKGKFKPRNCDCCGEEFQPNSKTQSHCSYDCSGKVRSDAKRGPRCKEIPGECKHCEKPFLGRKDQKYCSPDCGYAYKRRVRTQKECTMCGTSFEVVPSRNPDDTRKYCSADCRSSDPQLVKHLRKITQDQQKLSMTSIEKIGYELLDAIGEPYTPQKMLAGRFCVDAVLKDLDLVIQFDGDYWHGHPEKFPEPTKQQKKRMQLDSSQDAYLKKCGFSILRIWESDIKGDLAKVRARIRRRIREMKACEKRSEVTTGKVRRKHVSGERSFKVAA